MDAIQDPAQESPELKARLSEGQANSLYRSAYVLAQQGRLDHASALFLLLGMYRPETPRYPLAAGICMRRMGQYEDAIRMFARTMELQPEDFGPAFQLIECLQLLGRREQAHDILRMLRDAAEQQGSAGAVDRATALLQFAEASVQ